MDDSSALPPGEHHRVADHQRGEADEAKPRSTQGTKRLLLSITKIAKIIDCIRFTPTKAKFIIG